MKRNILAIATTVAIAFTSTASALPAIQSEAKPKAEATFAKLYRTMDKNETDVQLRKLRSALNSLVGNSKMYDSLDPYKE